MVERSLLVISSRLREAAVEVAAGYSPRKDFLELARVLDAGVIDYDTVDRSSGLSVIRRLMGMPVAQAWVAFRQRGAYDAIFTDGEHIGIPLALLLRFCRRAPRHVMIGHRLSSRSKRLAFRVLQPGRRLSRVIVHAVGQQRVCAELGLPSARVALLPYGVDEAFWSVSAATVAGPAIASSSDEAVICSAGLEYRDYATLAAAVNGLPVRVVIAAGSRWSRHRAGVDSGPLPANVEVRALDYACLRNLYARSRFVVVPLHQVDNQAGITTILEAMAMGKAVIVTATRGQHDTVRGRFCTAGGPAGAPRGGPMAFANEKTWGTAGAPTDAETGLYVPSGDATALRSAIRYLLDNPAETERLGAAGRRLVTSSMSLEAFVHRIAALVQAEPLTHWQVGGRSKVSVAPASVVAGTEAG